MAAPFSIDLKKFEILKSTGEVTFETEPIEFDINLISRSSALNQLCDGNDTSDTAGSDAQFVGGGYLFRGTLISTRDGDIAIENIRVGDLVRTLDHGFQPVRWVGGPIEPPSAGGGWIRIAKGTLGNNRELYVSARQRMLLSGCQLELLFGDTEVLAPASALTDVAAEYQPSSGEASYHQILFDNHEIIFAEGALTESLQPGLIDLTDHKSLGSDGAHLENAENADALPVEQHPARPVLRPYEARVAAHEIGLCS